MHAEFTHPIAVFAHRVRGRLIELADSSPLFMPTREKAAALVELEQARDLIAALEMRLMATGEDVTESGAHRTVADFLADRIQADRGPLAALEQLGRSLDMRWQRLGHATSTGEVSLEKARIIAKSLEALAEAEGVTAEILLSAEEHLVSRAPSFTARELRILGKRVLDVVAPEIGEDAEARALEAEERRAEAALTMTFIPRPDGLDGVTEIRFRGPDAVAGRLRTYLEAITAPRAARLAPNSTANDAFGSVNTTTDDVRLTAFERRPYARRQAEAFCSLLEHLDPEKLPEHGGTATAIVVTIPLADLRSALAGVDITAGADGVGRISAGEVRRLACTAQIIPAVLGSKSEVLDLGRSQRLFSTAQHRALGVRDRTCRAEGCSVPATWCEAHHFKDPWSRGGKTNLSDGKLFCPWHHHRAHDDRYLHEEMPNGDVRFSRRR